MPTDSTERSERVARAFYTMLQREGFEDEQIVELATQLVEMVTTDLRSEHPIAESIAAK